MKRIFAILLIIPLILVGCSEKEKAKPYTEEASEISVDGGTLGCTITLPEKVEGEIPVILMIPGSGPTPKDGIANEFADLAHDLAENKIASLRYDKRGILDSSNIVLDEEKVRVSDYVGDIEALISNLKHYKRFSKVFVLGHSQGGLYGALAIQKEKVAGFISLAAPGRNIDEVVYEQITNNKANPEELVKESRDILDSLKSGKKVNNMSKVLQPLFRPSVQPYLMDWMRYNPAEVYKTIADTPTLIIQGKNDRQVFVKDAELLKKANPKAKLIILDNMTHVLKDVKDKDNEEEYTEVFIDPEKGVNKEMVDAIVLFANNN